MKISVDDNELFVLTDVQKKVIMNDIREDIFGDDMKRRLKYILMNKYEECYRRLKSEWEPKLKENGVKLIPTDEEEFAKLVFSQTNYKNRSQRDAAFDVLKP